MTQSEVDTAILLDRQIEELRQSSVYVATSYRIAPDEITALKQALVLFAEANERAIKHIGYLESIRPRIVDVDGRKLRWDAPTEMIRVDNF